MSLMPNTTQVPHIFIRLYMPKLSDTGFRLLMIITDQTMGWIENRETGMRKTQDWISYSQLKTKTGRGTQAISSAIKELEAFKLIEVRDQSGNVLIDKKDRLGKKLYYRINTTSLKIKEVDDNLFENQNLKIKDTKVTDTKVDLSNDKSSEKMDVNFVIDLFKDINPSYERLFPHKGQRSAVERLIKKFGFEAVCEMVKKLPGIVSQPYAPVVTSPVQLENKIGEIALFVKKQKGGQNGGGQRIAVISPDPDWK